MVSLFSYCDAQQCKIVIKTDYAIPTLLCYQRAGGDKIIDKVMNNTLKAWQESNLQRVHAQLGVIKFDCV